MTFKLGDRSTRLNVNNYAQMVIGQNKIPGTSSTRLQGLRTLVGTNTQELIWDYSSANTWPSNAGEAFALVSTSNSDIGVLVEVAGLDENFAPVSQFVICNGITPVPLRGLWTRLNQATVYGTQACVGTITVSGSNVFGAILPARQQHMAAKYSIGRSRTFQVHSLLPIIAKVGGATATNVSIRLFYRERPDGVFKMEFPLGLTNQATSTTEYTEPFPVAIPGPADIYLTAEADAAGVSTSVRMQLLFERVD